MEDTQPDRNIIAKDSAATKPEAGFDLESNGGSAHLVNDAVRHFSWKDLTVQIKDRKTKKTLPILEKAHGIVHAGEMLAIMGPSGSGKTTLLNALAHRKAAASATTAGDVMANGRKIGLQTIRQLSSYVEQEDALIGSLTVQETMKVAANLALSGYDHRTFM